MYKEIFDPLETIPPERLFKDIEKPKLLKQLQYVLDNSAFYKKKFKEFKSANDAVDNFQFLPFTEKKEVIDDQLEHPPFGSNLSTQDDRVVRVHRTSGTTGRAVFIPLTNRDIEVTVYAGARCFWGSGLRPHDRVVHCLNYCMWIGGYTDHQSLEKTGAAVIPYGVGNSKNLIEAILDLKPTAIHCTISYLKTLESILEQEFHLAPSDLGLKKGLFGGEGGVQERKKRKSIEDIWGIKAMDANYGVSDVLSMFGGECQEQMGLHFMGQGSLYVELIDPKEEKPLAIEKGVQGEFVLTNIEREAQPMVRFRTHDMVEILDHEKCICGRTSFRFKVLGRSDDMIVVKGLNVYPGNIGSVVTEFLDDTTGEYQVIVEKKQPIENIAVQVEYNKRINKDAKNNLQFSLERRLKEKTGIKIQVELIPEGSLPRTEGKSKRLIWVLPKG
jgi:phenylacetate-CoA ligase